MYKRQNWKTLSALITARLERGSKTDVKLSLFSDFVTGTDARANFRGCVLPALLPRKRQTKSDSDADKALHLTLHQAAILQPQSFEDTIFGSPSNFRDTLFSGGDANFRGAQFSGGYADFRYAQFSGGYAIFRHTQFSGGEANFRQTKFSGGNADFHQAEFSGGNAEFREAWFAGTFIDFQLSQFSGGDANFSQTKFSGGYAVFLRTKFSGGKADFRHAKFLDTFAYFRETQFVKSIHFQNARFEKKEANFENAVFPPAIGSQSAFGGTQFFGPVKFSRTNFTNRDGKKLQNEDLHFPFNAFAHANIKDQIILTQRGDEEAQIEFDRALKSVAEACKIEADKNKIEAHYVALEAGCTTLKRAMEQVSDKNRAQRFFKFELLARQQRPSTPWLVKRFTTLYGWTADYGGSIARPLISLAVTWLAFAFIYGLTAYFTQVKPASIAGYIWGPLEFSASHIFRPLFIWSTSTPSPDISWIGKFRAQLYGGEWFIIKLIATLQSFASLTLLFLFGLATKRKFQIG